MKKYIIFMLAVLTLLTCLAGCGNKSTGDNSTQTNIESSNTESTEQEFIKNPERIVVDNQYVITDQINIILKNNYGESTAEEIAEKYQADYSAHLKMAGSIENH